MPGSSHEAYNRSIYPAADRKNSPAEYDRPTSRSVMCNHSPRAVGAGRARAAARWWLKR
jgi:hypothetical protein